MPAFFTVLAVMLVGIAVIQIRPLFLWLLTVGERIPVIRRFSHSLRNVYESSYELMRPVPLAIAVGLGVVSWAGECLAFFLILWGLGITPSWALLWQATLFLRRPPYSVASVGCRAG